jgi:hypothetical protein
MIPSLITGEEMMVPKLKIFSSGALAIASSLYVVKSFLKLPVESYTVA